MQTETQTQPQTPAPDAIREIERGEQTIKTLEMCKRLVEERLANFSNDIPKINGQISAYNLTTQKIRDHVDGVKKLQTDGELTEDEFKVAVKWIGEVHGIPNNLVEVARINLRRTEGAVVACNGIIEGFGQAIEAEKTKLIKLAQQHTTDAQMIAAAQAETAPRSVPDGANGKGDLASHLAAPEA